MMPDEIMPNARKVEDVCAASELLRAQSDMLIADIKWLRARLDVLRKHPPHPDSRLPPAGRRPCKS